MPELNDIIATLALPDTPGPGDKSLFHKVGVGLRTQDANAAGGGGGGSSQIEIPLYCGDRTTPITAAAVNVMGRQIAFDVTLLEAQAYLTIKAATGTFTVDVNRNGVSILSTKITIDANEESSLTAAIQPAFSATNLTKGDIITVDVDNAANGLASGLIVTLIGTIGTVADSTAPTVPTSLVANAVSGSQINLTWNPSTDNIGVTGYIIERATDSGFTTGLTTITVGNVVAHSDTGLAGATQYWYRIKARDAANNQSANSTSANDTTFTALPSSSLKNDWEADSLDATLNDDDTITTVVNNVTSGSSGNLTAAGAQPVIFKTGQINGHGSIRIAESGAGGYLSVASPLEFDQFTIAFIGKVSNYVFASDGGAASRKLGRASATSLTIRSNVSDENTVTGFTDIGNYSHIVIVHDNTNTKVYQNGTLIGTLTPASGANWRLNLLGIEFVGGGSAGVDIVRWIEYNAALSGAALTQLHDALDDYCGF